MSDLNNKPAAVDLKDPANYTEFPEGLVEAIREVAARAHANGAAGGNFEDFYNNAGPVLLEASTHPILNELDSIKREVAFILKSHTVFEGKDKENFFTRSLSDLWVRLDNVIAYNKPLGK